MSLHVLASNLSDSDLVSKRKLIKKKSLDAQNSSARQCSTSEFAEKMAVVYSICSDYKDFESNNMKLGYRRDKYF
jgi:hypothetical protein